MWHPLASSCGLHAIQDDGAGLQGCQRNCTHLPPNTGQTTRPSTSTSLHYIRWPAGNGITESKQSSLSEAATLLCSGTSAVDQTPDQCQDNRVTRHLPQKTHDSFVQTSPRPRIAWQMCGQGENIMSPDYAVWLRNLLLKSKKKKRTPFTFIHMVFSMGSTGFVEHMPQTPPN